MLNFEFRKHLQMFTEFQKNRITERLISSTHQEVHGFGAYETGTLCQDVHRIPEK